MTKLVIVESNAKCKKIESYLGKGYKVVASFGHIRGITDGLKAIDMQNNFTPTPLPQCRARYLVLIHREVHFNWSGKQSLFTGVGLRA